MSSTEKIKARIFTTGPAVNKTFLMSREKFLGYATAKFDNDVTYSLDKRRVALMHTRAPTTIDYSRTSLLQNDLGKLYGVLWDKCDC